MEDMMTRKMIAVLAFVLLFILIVTVFAQNLKPVPAQNAQLLHLKNRSLEARVAVLEQKVAQLEKMLNDPPVRVVPCEK